MALARLRFLWLFVSFPHQLSLFIIFIKSYLVVYSLGFLVEVFLSQWGLSLFFTIVAGEGLIFNYFKAFALSSLCLVTHSFSHLMVEAFTLLIIIS